MNLVMSKVTQHKVIEWRKLTPDNIAFMTDEEFVNANHLFIATMNRWKEKLLLSGWLTAEDIDEYAATFRKAEESIGKEIFINIRKLTEAIVCDWSKNKFDPLRGDTSSEGYAEVSSALYNLMQHAIYLSDEEWKAKFAGLSAATRSAVVGCRREAKNNVDFPNPLRREMEVAWRLPDGYDNEQVKESLTPLASFVPKAIQLHKQGENFKALGICFDLLDMLVVLQHFDYKFFYSTDGTTKYSLTLMTIIYYVISNLYDDENLSAEAKTEILSRIDDYYRYYRVPGKWEITGNFTSKKVIQHYSKYYCDKDVYDFCADNTRLNNDYPQTK